MEVDRVSRMGGVGQEGQPSWNGGRANRRKFVEEVPEPESEGEDTATVEAEAEAEEQHAGGLDVVA